MKHMRSLLAGLLFFCAYSQARDFNDQTFQLNAGPIFNYAQYELGCLPKIQGYLAGIHTDFTYRASPGFFTQLQFDGRWNAGPVCGSFDTRAQVRDFRPEFYLGYNFSLKTDHAYLAPLVGVGFYHLSFELEPNIMTYRYFNLYVPVGFDVQWWINPDEFDIGLRAVYRPDVYTKLKVSTPCIEECECAKIDLCRSHGVHIEMPFTWYASYDLKANWVIKAVPFFDWNSFGAANEVNENCLCVEIPQLDRWHLGVRLDFGLKF